MEYIMQKSELNRNKFRTQVKFADKAARQVLGELFRNHRPADRTLSVFFRENRQCGSKDRQFISESIYALLRYWGILRQFLPEERRVELENGNIRLGVQELPALFFAALYLDFQFIPWANALAEEVNIPWPKPANGPAATMLDRAEALAERFGHPGGFSLEMLVPEWVREKLPADFPMERFLDDLQRRPPMWLRCQCDDLPGMLDELAAAGLNFRCHERMEKAVAVENSRVNLFTLEAFKEGKFEVQDLASQCIGLAAAPKRKSRWWDACAGAGGKTLQLADLMGRTGTVVAGDIREYKLEDLRRRARRAGFPNIMTRAWDGKNVPPKQQQKFDGVLVDAPCSCGGVWRRNPDGRWILTPEEIAEAAGLQFDILNAAAPAVAPGGVLVYATCSLFPEENQDVVNRFLSEHPEFMLEEFANPLTGESVNGMLQVYSFDGDCDCMFVSRMRRKGNENE